MKNRILREILYFTVALTAAANVTVAAQQLSDPGEKVERVSAVLQFSGPVHDVLKDRIQESVLNVGSKALLGKKIGDAASLRASLEQVMKKIFNEVLSGYKVDSVEITIAKESKIELYLKPEEPFVRGVSIEVVPQAGINRQWIEFFEKKLAAFKEDCGKELGSVPVGSARWSEELLVADLRGKLAKENLFPGFNLSLKMELSENAVIRVTPQPASPTIRMVFVKTRSTTLPSLFLERLKIDLSAHADFLLGLPIEFVKANEEEVKTSFDSYLRDNSQANRLGLTIEIKPLIAKRTIISVLAESEKYSGFLRGKVSIGEEDRNPDIEGHLGLFPYKRTEVFGEVNFLPGPIEFQMDFGIGHKFGKHFYAAAGRNVVDGLNRAWVNYYLTEDIIFSWERNVTEKKEDRNEGSVTFRAHDFFSFGLVTDFQQDVWVRLVTNL